MKKLSELSVFFPFWNEEKNLEQVVKKTIPVAQKVSDNWEILIIDDGSSDNTLKVARKLSEKNENLKVISHNQNRGYGAALKTGLQNAKYKNIVFTDGDGQFDFSEVEKFINESDKADFVIGYRKKRLDNPFRHLLMNLLKIWDFVLFGFTFKDIDCGFKFFKKDAVLKIYPLKSEGAMITTEILAKAKKRHLKIAEVEVNHYPRVYGTQSGGNIRVILRAIKESLILWKDINFSYGRN